LATSSTILIATSTRKIAVQYVRHAVGRKWRMGESSNLRTPSTRRSSFTRAPSPSLLFAMLEASPGHRSPRRYHPYLLASSFGPCINPFTSPPYLLPSILQPEILYPEVEYMYSDYSQRANSTQSDYKVDAAPHLLFYPQAVDCLY
jgi:hypothetical protein